MNILLEGDVLDRLLEMASNSVDCICTSPPYWGLRNYGIPPTKWPAISYSILGLPINIPEMECCLGDETTPHQFIGHLVLIFEQCRRVLKPTGTCWINMGDSYIDSKMTKHNGERSDRDQSGMSGKVIKASAGLKAKDLVGIPWMMAFALRDAGWYLRQDIIWAKPNPMPESVTDRCTKSHEYIFLLTKSKSYYYDAEAIKQPVSASFANDKRHITGSNDNNIKIGYEDSLAPNPKGPHSIFGKSGNKQRKTGAERGCPEDSGSNVCGSVPWEGLTANKRDVWTITTKPCKEAHFATFPTEIPENCIKAGSSEHGCCSACGKPYRRVFTKELVPTDCASHNTVADARDEAADAQDAGSNLVKDGFKPGWANKNTTTGWEATCACQAQVIPATVLDIFDGSGTTRLVARKLRRNAIGIELNPAYRKISQKRLKNELGMFF